MTSQNLISFLGMFALMGFAWIFSSDRKTIHWRVVLWGMLLQISIALFIFKIPAGAWLFLRVNNAVVRMLDCANAGSQFLFGALAVPPGQAGELGEKSLG